MWTGLRPLALGLLLVGRVQPLVWCELAAEVRAGFVLASALRLKGHPGIARCKDECRVFRVTSDRRAGGAVHT